MGHMDNQLHVATNSGIESLIEGETKLTEVRRHPFGLVVLYFQAAIGVLVGFGLIMFLIGSLVGDSTGFRTLLSLVGVVVVALMMLLLLIATYVYQQNRLIITDKNLTQVLQRGIFNRQVSELSMANVEDVTADKRGLFPTLFNFGELRVETAGEQNNFIYAYCPRPGYYRKIILDARQRYIDNDPEAMKRANERLNVPPAPVPIDPTR